MANIVSDQTEISFAESITGWTGDTFILETDIKVQGTASVSTTQTSSGVNIVTYSGSWNVAGSHLRIGVNSSIIGPYGATKANNGVEVVVDHAGGTARWTVDGSDTYKGGWADYLINADSTPTSGTAISGNVTAVSVVINTVSKPRNIVNGWYDNWRFGNGLTINSTTTEAINFQIVADADELLANAWGILRDIDGVLFGKGKLTLGSTGSLNCNLVSVGETIYFIDRNVATDLYAIVAQQGTGLTDIDISGMTCKTVGATGAELDFSATINSCLITGSSFTGMGAISFNPSAIISVNTFTDCSSMTLNDCVFDSNNINNSGLITVGTGGTFNANTVNKSTAPIAVTTGSAAKITRSKFTSGDAGYGIEITTPGTYDFIGNLFNGFGATGSSTACIYNNSGGLVTLNISGIEAAESPPPKPVFEELLIYYGFPIAYNGLWNTQLVIDAISARYSYYIVGQSYEDPLHEEYASTVTIVNGLRANGVKVYGYVPIGLSTSAWTIQQISDSIDNWDTIGVDGIFLDEFGFDYTNTRTRQNDAVDLVHAKGLNVCANSFVFEDAHTDTLAEVPWISSDWRYINFQTYNPTDIASHLTASDAWLFENFFVDHLGTKSAWDANEKMSLVNSSNTKGLNVWAEGVVAESTPGVVDLTKITPFTTYRDLVDYVSINAYMYGISVLGMGGFSFGAAGVPIEELLLALPEAAAAASGPIVEDYVNFIFSRPFGTYVTLSSTNVDANTKTATITEIPGYTPALVGIPTFTNGAGASTILLTGQNSFTFTILPALTGYEYRIYTVTALGSLAGAAEIQGLENATLSSYTYTYSYEADTPIAVQILGHANDYEESITYYTLGNTDQNVIIQLKKDDNN